MRECGECTVCCELIGVPELGKPAYSQCEHACGGCQIYETKPSVCGLFECLWLQGTIINDDLRPDKCGLMTYLPLDYIIPKTMVVKEAWDGALQTKESLIYIKVLALRYLCYIIKYLDEEPRRYVVGPPHLVKQAATFEENENAVILENFNAPC